MWGNPDVCFDARIVSNGSSYMSPGFHINVPQYTTSLAYDLETGSY